eukprot:UN20392
MSSGGLVWLRKRISTSFRPRNQLVHQYHGLNGFS